MEQLLRSVVEELAPIPRLPTSDGERQAAELIRERLDRLGCRAGVDEVPAYRSYARPVGLLCALAAGSGLAASLTSLAAMADIGRRPAVPGANDNLTGVAALVALAAAFRENPPPGLRILLVSAGAEEALQEGIRAFAGRYFARLPKRGTWFVNLDTLGSGRLVLLEGEGPVRMPDYDAGLQDLVARCARAEGVPPLRGLRSRNSTDGAVPQGYGYPTTTIGSVDSRKLIPHYHLDSDLPEQVDYRSVRYAVRLVEAVARTL